MFVGRDFDPSDVGEDEVYSFNFVNDLNASESLATAVWTCTAVTGVDASAATRVNGGATVSGQTTSQRITGLLPGVRYRLLATAVTLQSNTVSLWAHVTCANPK